MHNHLLSPLGHIGVAEIAEHYMAVEFRSVTVVCISDHLESDVKIAQQAAETFAKQQGITIATNCILENKFVTIVQLNDGTWRPIKLFRKNYEILDQYLGKNTEKKANKNNAIFYAKGIEASARGFHYLDREFSLKELETEKKSSEL